ncbi:MAG: S-adenosylhomocysteine/5'-methylthioadenosine [Prolixibacteraceae bacterium]|nr:MAG: S-adenosylhomocysteine/5'-methylthioadenosine [Prolixibacteraceae bacterium]
MEILIVSATWLEVELLADEFEFIDESIHLLKKYRFNGTQIDILITGIGTTFTAFHLTNALRDKRYNFVINVGIAGSLTDELNIGEVVSVVSDEFADLGIEKENEFLTLFETGFMDENEFPFEQGILKASENGLFDLKKVRGITTNISHGRAASIAEIKSKFSAQVESMEGAVVLYVCNWFGIPCFQIRAISNFVEPRDSAKWNIPLALEKLNETVFDVLKKLAVEVH